MAIEGVGAVFNDGSSDIGEVVTINIPDDEAKEYEVTSLSDTREQFKLSAMSVGQVCTLTIRLNPEAPQFTKGATLTGAVITLPKQDPASTTNEVILLIALFVLFLEEQQMQQAQKV